MQRIYITLLAFLFTAFGCSNMPDDPGKPIENNPPETELSNLPPDDPFFSNPVGPEITFHWTGTDLDGYITGFKYRWCSIKNNDTTWKEWIVVSAASSDGSKNYSANGISLIIESPDDKNNHIFEVAAVDNHNAVDPTPARIRFCTKKGEAAETILSSSPGKECIVNNNMSESWTGLSFTFNDETSKYSYRINSGQWSSYSDTNNIILTGSVFPSSGDYKIYFKAKNKYAVEDETPLEYGIKIIKPEYKNDLLLIDMTADGIGITGSPSDDEYDNFYSTVSSDAKISSYELYDVKANGFPSREKLANFKYILIYNDNSYSEFENKLLKTDIDALSDYLNTGGRLILSGWIPSNIFFNSAQADTFFYKYFQVNMGRENFQNVTPNCNSFSGYPALRIDESKFPMEWSGKFASLELFSPRAFSEKIYTLNSSSSNSNGKTLITLLGTSSYKTILSSVPLYYFNKTDVTNFLIKAISDLK